MSLCCRLLQRLRRHGWPADAAVLILVAGLAVVGSAAVAAAAVGATGAAEVGNSYLRATAAVAHTRAGVIATTDARGGQAPSVFEARMSPEARTALAIDYETRRPGARTVSLHLVGATATVAGPWIEETVRIDDRWSIGEEDASEHTCLIDPFNGRIEAVWWYGL